LFVAKININFELAKKKEKMFRKMMVFYTFSTYVWRIKGISV